MNYLLTISFFWVISVFTDSYNLSIMYMVKERIGVLITIVTSGGVQKLVVIYNVLDSCDGFGLSDVRSLIFMNVKITYF